MAIYATKEWKETKWGMWVIVCGGEAKHNLVIMECVGGVVIKKGSS